MLIKIVYKYFKNVICVENDSKNKVFKFLQWLQLLFFLKNYKHRSMKNHLVLYITAL